MKELSLICPAPFHKWQLQNYDSMETENPNEDQAAKRVKYKERKCRYYDKGICKYKSKCGYFHPNQICEEYERTGNCQGHNCKDRHPERCRQRSSGKMKNKQKLQLFSCKIG